MSYLIKKKISLLTIFTVFLAAIGQICYGGTWQIRNNSSKPLILQQMTSNTLCINAPTTVEIPPTSGAFKAVPFTISGDRQCLYGVATANYAILLKDSGKNIGSFGYIKSPQSTTLKVSCHNLNKCSSPANDQIIIEQTE